MVRGRIARINGLAPEQVRIAPEAEWAVKGDRGLTMAAEPPADSRIVAGTWWPSDYRGAPLVSMDANIAKGLGLKVGDTVGISVLGRELTATIASLREIDWASLSMNFTFILSPGALDGAPHSYIATVRPDPKAEEAVEKRVTDALPNVSSIRVKEALDALKSVVASAGVAVRAAGAITLAAGALVLAGAVAAGHRRRVYEAVVLKVLGATRRDLWRAFLIEYGILGTATGLIAGLIGSIAAWAILSFVMHAHWQFLPGIAAATVAACLAATLLIGFAGTWHALGAKVSPYLRND
jgi:putative ABC transport system permease protein